MRLDRWGRRLSRICAITGVALFALLTVGLASADFGQPNGITKEAHEMHNLYLLVLGLGALVFVAVEGALLWAIFRYRRKNDELPVQTHGSTVVELIWTGIPVAIVITLFTFSFIVLRDVEHKNNDQDMMVDVTGFQFQWQFVYHMNRLGPNAPENPQGQDITVIGTAKDEPTLVIPVDEPIQFKLTSNDVIHSFFIRDFLYKLDVVPGRDNRFTITARETGDFIGQCAELCGLNHALMRFHVKVLERGKFDEWVAQQAGGNKAAAVPQQ